MLTWTGWRGDPSGRARCAGPTRRPLFGRPAPSRFPPWVPFARCSRVVILIRAYVANRSDNHPRSLDGAIGFCRWYVATVTGDEWPKDMGDTTSVAPESARSK